MSPRRDKNITGHLEDTCNDFQPCQCLWLGATLPVVSTPLVPPSFPPVVEDATQAAIPLLPLRSEEPRVGIVGRSTELFQKVT